MHRRVAIMTRARLGVTLILTAAVMSFLLSIVLWFTDNRDEGVFVGLWVPSILAAGGFWMAAVRTRRPVSTCSLPSPGSPRRLS